jgi:hypothetical protein
MTWPDRDTYVYKLRCWIGGVQYALASFPARRIQLGQRTTCSLELTSSVPGANTPQPVRVDVGLLIGGSVTWYRFVTGYFVHDQTRGGPQAWRGIVIDCMWKLEQALQSDITWSSTPVETALLDLLQRAGLDDSEIGFLFAPGSVWNLGNFEDIVIEAGEQIRGIFDRVLEHAGLTFFVNAGGAVNVVPDVSIPSQDGSPVFASGVANGFELPADTIGFAAPERLWTDWQAVIIEYTATGPLRSDGFQPNATVATSILDDGVADGRQFPYFQTTAVCEARGRQVIRRSAARTRSITFQTNLQPLIYPWQSCKIISPEIDLDTETGIVIRSSANDGGLTTFIAALGPSLVATDTDIQPVEGEDAGEGGTGGLGDGGLDPVTGEIAGVEPIASITTTIDVEPLSGSGSIAYVFADGSQSLSNNGGTLTYSWTATPGSGSVSPSTSTEVSPLFKFDTLTGSTLALTVAESTDPTLTNTLTIELDGPDIEEFTRVVQYALADGTWGVEYSTQAGPAEYTSDIPGATFDCVGVPRYNEQGKLWALFSSGLNTALYRREPSDFSQFPEFIDATNSGEQGTTWLGVPSDIFVGEPFVNEQLLNLVLVGLRQPVTGGFAYVVLYSTNATADVPTFQRSAALPTITATASVNFGAVFVSAYDSNRFTVCVGRYLFESTNRGNSWTIGITNPDANAVAEDLAIAPWGTACVFSNVATDANRVRFTDASLSVDWSGVVTTGMEMQTITPLLAREGYKVGSNDGSVFLLLLSGSVFTATDIAQISSGNIFRGVRDGEIPLAFFASDGGVYKQANDDSTLEKIVNGDAVSVGYGGIGLPQLKPGIEVVIGDNDGNVWYYNQTAGWQKQVVTTSGVRIREVVANPFNPDEWIAVGQDGVHYTNDTGSTWTQLVTASGTRDFLSASFHDFVDGAWMASGQDGNIRTGTNNGPVTTVNNTLGWQNSRTIFCVSGTGTDWILAGVQSGLGIEFGLNTHTATGVSLIVNNKRDGGLGRGTAFIDRRPGDSRVIIGTARASASIGYYVVKDYNVDDLILYDDELSTGNYWNTFAKDGLYKSGENLDQVRFYSSPLTVPPSSPLVPIDYPAFTLVTPEISGTVGAIRAARQSRETIKTLACRRISANEALNRDCLVFTEDVGAWQILTGPQVSDGLANGGDLENNIECILRLT